MKKRVEEFCSDFEQKCKCKNMMPATMAGCCSDMFNDKEKNEGKKQVTIWKAYEDIYGQEKID